MNTTPSSSLKRRASRCTVVGDSGSTTSSAASSVIMSAASMTNPNHKNPGINKKGGGQNFALSKKPLSSRSYIRELFKIIGHFSALQPWETIISFGVLYISVLSIPPNVNNGVDPGDSWNNLDVVTNLAKVISFVLFSYCLKRAYYLKSSKILGIIMGYTCSLTFLFYFFMFRHKNTDIQVAYDSWPLLFYVIDFPSVTSLAQFILCASHPDLISRIVAKSMAVLGPSFLTKTLGKIGLFGMLHYTNALSPVAWYSLVINILNFFMFISIYPAILSLYFELTHGREPSQARYMVEKAREANMDTSEDLVVTKVMVFGTVSLAVFHLFLFRPENIPFMLCFCIKAIFLILCISLGYINMKADTQMETQESIKSLINYLQRQLDDISVDTDVDNCEETSASSRSDEAMLSSTDEGIGTCSDKKPVIKPPSGSTVKIAVLRPSEDSSSDWSDASMSKYNNSVPEHNANGIKCNALKSSSPKVQNKKAQNNPKVPPSKVQQHVPADPKDLRPIEQCRNILKEDPSSLTDEEVIQLMEAKDIRVHALETILGNHLRGVEVRRKYLLKQKHMKHVKSLNDLPYEDYNYELVMGACAESVIGVMTLPVGCVGPIKLDGQLYHVPMATTEGCLVASTNRGCSALTAAGGVTSRLYQDVMSRAPILEFASCTRSIEVKEWMEDPDNFAHMKSLFETTSRFAKLLRLEITPSGRKLYVRFVATTGDAMGMNMLSKATEHVLKELQNNVFLDMHVISLSGNMCTDKKPSAMNWIRGRGKGVVCEAVIPAAILEKTLKTSVDRLVKTNISKNYEGSALAGSIGGNNAHAANIVTAIFIATGQDVAQTIESSNCSTFMEPTGPDLRDLYMSVTMPSVEVGTVGGGTVLSAQGTCLDMLGVRGSHGSSPGTNSRQLAKIIAATVLAGELSLMSALTEGHLVRSHLRHNRSSATVGTITSLSEPKEQLRERKCS